MFPLFLQQEEQRIHDEINEKVLSVVFDGTACLGEALAIILRFDWTYSATFCKSSHAHQIFNW